MIISYFMNFLTSRAPGLLSVSYVIKKNKFHLNLILTLLTTKDETKNLITLMSKRKPESFSTCVNE